MNKGKITIKFSDEEIDWNVDAEGEGIEAREMMWVLAHVIQMYMNQTEEDEREDNIEKEE